MKKHSLLFILVCLSFHLNAQQAIQEFIYFASDEYEITAASKTKLDGLIESISSFENPQIYLSGHTDDQGDQEYNLSLSKKRVNAVNDYLINRGLENANIKLDFYGETIPFVHNKTEQDRQFNRRVELKVFEGINEVVHQQETFFETAIKETEPIIETPEIVYENPRAVLADFESDAQRFCIQKDRDTILQGADGTILFFKAGSFNSKEVTCDCIEIQLKEFYSPEQIILNNLNTQAGNRLLETQGAIKVEAFCDNKLLNLKRGKKMDLYFPNLNEDNDYQLFSGNEEEHGVDWSKNTRNLNSQFLPDFGGQNGRGIGSRDRYCNYSFFLKRWFCNWRSKKIDRNTRRNLKSWISDIEEKYGEVNFVGLNRKIDNQTFRIFTSSQMGYINCDRFLSFPKRQLANLFIKEKSKSKSQRMMTSIIFKDMNSVMTGSMDTKGRHWYLKVPKQKKVWVVAIKKEKGDYYLAIKDHILSNQPIEDLVFEQVSPKELSQSLATIGW